MANWISGQSGNPRGRARRGKTVGELARAIGRERIEFKDGPGPLLPEAATYSRLERLVRVLWTQALDGDIKAIRCLLEYMEGRPGEIAAAAEVQGGVVTLTGDELFRLLGSAIVRFEAWRQASESPGAAQEGRPQDALPVAGLLDGAPLLDVTPAGTSGRSG